MKQTGDYYNVVVEDTHVNQVIATATLIIEHKFIHSCAKVSLQLIHCSIILVGTGYNLVLEPIIINGT